MSEWCNICYREPYKGCDRSCPIFGLDKDELAKKYFADKNPKTLRDCKESLDRVIRYCNDNDDFETAENIEIYLRCLRDTCVHAVEHIIDLDGDYVRDNFDSWSDYLMENIGINYEDFKTITNCELADIFKED